MAEDEEAVEDEGAKSGQKTVAAMTSADEVVGLEKCHKKCHIKLYK
jgi:hypothetical protein